MSRIVYPGANPLDCGSDPIVPGPRKLITRWIVRSSGSNYSLTVPKGKYSHVAEKVCQESRKLACSIDQLRSGNMRIAQVAPLYESVPPKLYGGTERVVSFLTEELVRLGHEVTLFASGDSMTSARLVSVMSSALRLDARCKDQLAQHILCCREYSTCKDEFDLVHFHWTTCIFL